MSEFKLNLDSFFDDDLSSVMLSASSPDLKKSAQLYNFDLDNKDGVLRLLAALPILKDDLVKDVALEIWPDHKKDSPHTVKMLRSHIRGYLLDYLNEEDKAV
tara:strand:- start:13543 stop:13848 length:306 start_codon:yes stop_codon:yes gene_type:complete